ncbi:hypothetical protein, partial [Bradyrhizobium oligotrophicum]|uniref:hypothetical protein n=1 Tax=Bradyrhizobium oligotrophicum TaxID=44255 RepID=UPI003EB8A854
LAMLKTAEESTPCTMSSLSEPDSRGTSPAMTVEGGGEGDSVTVRVNVKAAKKFSFVFPESVLYCIYPASSMRGVRAVVTRREAGMRWPQRVAA